jgi:hypothetical protein
MTLNPQPKSLLVLLAVMFASTGWAQQINSLGIFSGITVPYTYDAGINKDPRYRIKYNVKLNPIGIHYGVDYEGYGVMIDPSIVQIGQHFNVINTQGGQVGERKINLTYFQIPAGLKLHIIDLSFFRVSFVASVGVGFLLKGEGTITHNGVVTLDFPIAVTGEEGSAQATQFEADHPGYTVQYDGVRISPAINNLKLSKKSDFQSFQLFGGLGFRSDWDITESWRVSFDIRGNMGILEPRNKDYIDKVKDHQAIYDIYGSRRDLFLTFNIGIARTIEIEPQEKERKIRQRKESKPHRPSKYPWPAPRKGTSQN